MKTKSERKGIILAGGLGTRLYPMTILTSKQLLPVYDKPMIYYPLSVLMLTGLREIAIITTPQDQEQFRRLLGDGSQWGLRLTFIEQENPNGLAEAYLLSETFLDGAPSVMALGDNIFFGHNLSEKLCAADARQNGGTIFGYQVSDPQYYGVISFDASGRAVHIEEKPTEPRSNYAITGLYFFDETASERAKSVTPSARGELEITSLIEQYLHEEKLSVERLGRGFAWLDTGTHESLMEASAFIRTIEKRQGQKIGSPEEVAYLQGFIDRLQLLTLAERHSKTNYGAYLKLIAGDDVSR